MLAIPSVPFTADYTAAQTSQDRGGVRLEMTQVDLFGMKGWDSRQVSVLGFRLGMGRRDALLTAQQDEMRLDDDHGQGCLTAKTCSVIEEGKFNGIDLYFGESDIVEKIGIEIRFRNVSKEERSASVSNRFTGATHRFVESYSDNLRIRTFGRTDAIRAGKMNTPGWVRGTSTGFPSSPAQFEYLYSSLGLILHVDLHDPTFGTDPTVDRLTIEFVRPKRSR